MWAIHWSQVGGTAFQWYISCSVWAFASAWENEYDKEDSRCPYNHDPEKVAICKQFLKGTCSSLDCRLTHKVISEQLPDCLNFLLGFCTLEGCPYRHVNVSPNTPICDGFLKEFLLMVISVIKSIHMYVHSMHQLGIAQKDQPASFSTQRRKSSLNLHQMHIRRVVNAEIATLCL